MIKQPSKNIFMTLAIMMFVAIIALVSSVTKESYVGYVLIRSVTIDDVLNVINNVHSLSDVYLVALVKSMSDANITAMKFLQALEFRHVIAPVLLLLIFDINRVYFRSGMIKFGILLYAGAILVKYLLVFVIAVFITPSVMNPTILFEALGFTLLLQQVVVVISIIVLFAGVYSLSRNEVI